MSDASGVVQSGIYECSAHANFVARHFCEGGFAMYIIAFIGLLVFLLVIERGLSLANLLTRKKNINKDIFAPLLSGNLKKAIAFCDANPKALTNILKSGLIQVLNQRSDEEVQVAMDASTLRELPRLEGWGSFLAVLGNMSVLVGLVGTVVGLITSFSGIAEADNALKAALLSKGISEALNCTAFGLMVAITAIFFHGLFQIRISKATSFILENSMEIMNLVVANRDKFKSAKVEKQRY